MSDGRVVTAVSRRTTQMSRLTTGGSQHTFFSGRLSYHTNRVQTRASKKRRNTEDLLSDDSESDPDEIEYEKQYGNYKLSQDYVQISKFVKIAKFSNQTETVLALVALGKLITDDEARICIMKLAGVQLCINLLKVDHQRSLIAALKVLKQLSTHYFIVDEVIKLEGLKILLEMVEKNFKIMEETQSNRTQMILVIELLGVLAASRRVRKLIRSFDGLPLLMRFLQIDTSQYLKILAPPKERKSKKQSTHKKKTELQQAPRPRKTSSMDSKKFEGIDIYNLHVLQLATITLWKCSQNKGNVATLLQWGITETLASLLNLQIREIDLPIMRVVNQCCIQERFREEIMAMDLIYHCTRCLKHENHATIQTIASQTIGKCVEHLNGARDEVHRFNGLEALMHIVEKNRGCIGNLKPALFTFWMCLKDNVVNCNWLGDNGYAPTIIELIQTSNDTETSVYCFGVLRECMRMSDESCHHLLALSVTAVFVDNLQQTNPRIVVAVNQALEVAAHNEALRADLLENDVLRLVWSNMKSKHAHTVSTSADAISSLIVDPLSIAETMRSFVGGLELLIKLLQSTDNQITASVAKVVSLVACDCENQTILDDYGILFILVDQCKNRNTEVRKALCKCIVSYCTSEKYQIALRGAIRYLGLWLHSRDVSIKHEATHALYKLSDNSDNCLVMYKCGVVKHLIELIRSGDESLQEESAQCVRNIRLTIMASTS